LKNIQKYLQTDNFEQTYGSLNTNKAIEIKLQTNQYSPGVTPKTPVNYSGMENFRLSMDNTPPRTNSPTSPPPRHTVAITPQDSQYGKVNFNKDKPQQEKPQPIEIETPTFTIADTPMTPQGYGSMDTVRRSLGPGVVQKSNSPYSALQKNQMDWETPVPTPKKPGNDSSYGDFTFPSY